MTSESCGPDLLFGLLIGVLVGVISQCCLVAGVLCHIVPRDQTLSNGCSPWLETLGRRQPKMIIIISIIFFFDSVSVLSCPFYAPVALQSSTFSGFEGLKWMQRGEHRGFSTHQQRIGEIGQVGHQDAHQGAHHDEHRAHAKHHHRPIGYKLGVAATKKKGKKKKKKDRKQSWTKIQTFLFVTHHIRWRWVVGVAEANAVVRYEV